MATTITLSLNAPFTADQSLPRAQYSLEDEHDAHQDAHGLCFALGFPAALSTDGMLPAVTPCFTFNATLNIPLSAVESGTPIFDAQGRLLGLANPPNAAATSSGPRDATATAPGGRAIATRTTVIRIQPAHGGAPTDAGGEVPTHTDDTTPSNAAGGHQATAPMPELYERLAPTVAQILVFSTSEATARASER